MSSSGTALDLSYNYFANANVSSIPYNLNADRTQAFTYDYQNRVGTAQSQASLGLCTQLSFDANNRITGTAYTYDAELGQLASPEWPQWLPSLRI